MNTKDIINRIYENQVIYFLRDGSFNASTAAAYFGKVPKDWLKNQYTQEYIAALEKRLKAEESYPHGENSNGRILPFRKNQLVTVKEGAPAMGGGTWLHQKLVVPFARWLSADFAVWCDEQIERILKERILKRSVENDAPNQLERLLHEAERTYHRAIAEAYLAAGGQPPDYIQYLINLANETTEETMATNSKRPKLFDAKQAPAAVPTVPAEVEQSENNPMVGFRVNPTAHMALKRMALEEKSSNQKLLVEALNLLFQSRQKPPIA